MARYIVNEQPDFVEVIDTETKKVIWDWKSLPYRKITLTDKETAHKIATEMNGDYQSVYFSNCNTGYTYIYNRSNNYKQTERNSKQSNSTVKRNRGSTEGS